MPARKKPSTIYQLKVTLKDSKPPIWRRIQVAGNTKFSTLHDILQTVMGWYDCHLHQFILYGEHWGVPDPDDFVEMSDERKMTLDKSGLLEGEKFVYEYDFGDSWEHVLLVEKILTPEPGTRYPVCLTGKNACPPEDCGGVWGYEEFLEAVKDPSHPEHDSMLEWAGGAFDPKAFDLDAVNENLRDF